MSKSVGLRVEAWKDQQGRYLARGLGRIALWGAGFAMAFLFFNVIGYLIVTYDLWPSLGFRSNSYPESYIGRALLLAIIGLAQAALVVLCSVFACGALVAAYFGVLRLGGYKGNN